MNTQQMIEKIRRIAPELGETEILISLESGSKEFCENTTILNGKFQLTTEPNIMYYTLDEQCIAVEQADYNNQLMSEFVGNVDLIEIQE